MLTAAGPSVGKRGSCIGLHEDPGTYALGIIHLDWVGCFIWFFVFDLDGKHIYPQLYASFFYTFLLSIPSFMLRLGTISTYERSCFLLLHYYYYTLLPPFFYFCFVFLVSGGQGRDRGTFSSFFFSFTLLGLYLFLWFYGISLFSLLGKALFFYFVDDMNSYYLVAGLFL